jgi:hypothetical protein
MNVRFHGLDAVDFQGARGKAGDVEFFDRTVSRQLGSDLLQRTRNTQTSGYQYYFVLVANFHHSGYGCISSKTSNLLIETITW